MVEFFFSFLYFARGLVIFAKGESHNEVFWMENIGRNRSRNIECLIGLEEKTNITGRS